MALAMQQSLITNRDRIKMFFYVSTCPPITLFPCGTERLRISSSVLTAARHGYKRVPPAKAKRAGAFGGCRCFAPHPLFIFSPENVLSWTFQPVPLHSKLSLELREGVIKEPFMLRPVGIPMLLRAERLIVKPIVPVQQLVVDNVLHRFRGNVL